MSGEVASETGKHAAETDPRGIIASAPGVGPVTCAVVAGRLGDPHRFHPLAAIRAYSGLIPNLNQSGKIQHQQGLTKAGDPLLREALFTAADQARKIDPQPAAKYKRLMSTERHHDSAICHIATILLTRVATCWRTGQHYVLRDTDGRPITAEQGRHLVRAHHAIDKRIRISAASKRYSQRQKGRTGRKQQESPSAPIHRHVHPGIKPTEIA